MEKLIEAIRYLMRFFLKVFFPKLYYIENNEYSITSLSKVVKNSKISATTKILTPADISNCEIGDYTYISLNSKMSLTTIGKFCSIGPNLISGWGIHPTNGVSTSPVFYSTKKQAGISFSSTNKVAERKPIKIGNDVFIGMNVTILDGITIGNGAIIGAGSVVSKDIPPYAVAVGSPIQIKKYRFNEEIIKKLQRLNWWDFHLEDLQTVEEYFFDIEKFLKTHFSKIDELNR